MTLISIIIAMETRTPEKLVMIEYGIILEGCCLFLIASKYNSSQKTIVKPSQKFLNLSKKIAELSAECSVAYFLW